LGRRRGNRRGRGRRRKDLTDKHVDNAQPTNVVKTVSG
jgi:hypothetical protein